MVYEGKGDLDRAIADYSEAIRLDPEFVSALRNRGDVYRLKGEFDRAIEDYSGAIRLDPKYVVAFVGRGDAYRKKGDYDHAIPDYTEVIRLDPENAGGYEKRGKTNFLKGDFTAAATDLLRANLADSADSMLWLYLARRHSGQDGAAELSANAARLKSKNWPYQIIDFYLGRRSADEMLSEGPEPGERCEAHFFLGEWQLLGGNKTDAKSAFQAAVDACPKMFLAYDGAVAGLKRLTP
jgi:lipoprotein NlpI